jgi:hypothetical protein
LDGTCRTFEYRGLFQAMIQDWRRAWGQPFPFLFVQLANYMERKADPAERAWAELRESQASALALPNTGMAVAVPLAVRYAWADNPACNLSNKDGLPASPSRTDDWPGTTKPIP